MEISLQRMSATVIILGAVLFMTAAALPVSFRVFPEPSPVRKLERIEASPTAWSVAQVLFALGATLTVVGIACWRITSVTGPSHGSCRPVSGFCFLVCCSGSGTSTGVLSIRQPSREVPCQCGPLSSTSY